MSMRKLAALCRCRAGSPTWTAPEQRNAQHGTENEQAAVEDGHAAIDRLLEHLADVPTPAGPTPRQMDRPAGTTLLSIVAVNQRPTA